MKRPQHCETQGGDRVGIDTPGVGGVLPPPRQTADFPLSLMLPVLATNAHGRSRVSWWSASSTCWRVISLPCKPRG
jgi:hypothetical protein